MQRISECRVIFRHCGRSFIYPATYKSASTKRITMSGSVFQALSHFCNASTYAVHLPLLPLWVNWYSFCIFSGAKPKPGHRLVGACSCWCRIFMVDKVLVIHLVIKCDMCTLVLSHACFNDVRSISSHSVMWIRFWLDQY